MTRGVFDHCMLHGCGHSFDTWRVGLSSHLAGTKTRKAFYLKGAVNPKVQCKKIKIDNLFSNGPNIMTLGKCKQCQQRH